MNIFPRAGNQNLEEKVEVGAPSQDEVFAFLLLPHSASVLPVASSDTCPLPGGENAAVYDPFLPPPFSDKDRLVGRDRLLHQMQERILETQRIAIHGLPGVGKTALAIALTHSAKIRARFCDGILWAGLGLDGNLRAELRRWGTVLGVSLPEVAFPEFQETWPQVLREMIEERQLLLVIDDAWQVDVIKMLDIGGPGCGCILTTRFVHIATHFAGENTFLIPELEDVAGVEVLTRFAPQLMDCERETVRDLVRAVGGLPLALTLMSKYLGGHAFTHQPRRLRSALTHLQNSKQRLHLQVPQGPFERTASQAGIAEVSVESVIALSYDYLSEDAQKALRALAVFPAKPKQLSHNAVIAVTEAAVETLQTLCDAGLLEQARAGYYLIHPLIVDYGRLLGTEPAATARLIKYGVALVEAHAVEAEVLEQESAIIMAALHYAWEGRWYAELIRGVRCFVPWLLRWGWYRLVDQLLQQTATALHHAGDRQDEIILREQLSTLAHAQGNYTQSCEYAQEGLMLAYETGNDALAVTLLTQLGVIAQEQGDYARTEALYQEGLGLARAQGMTEQIIVLLKNLGVLAKKRGDYAQAQKDYREALTLACLFEYDVLRSLLLMNLGVVASEQGAYTQALTCYREGLALAQKTGSREQVCLLLCNMGVVADALGDYTQAERYMREGLALAREMGHRERISLLLLNLGVVVGRQGNDHYAEELYREGLALARKIGHHERISVLLLNLGDVVMEQGRDGEALAYYEEGLALAQKLGHRSHISDLQLHLGVLEAKRGEVERAKNYLRAGLLLAYQLGHPQLICKGLTAWGELYLERRELQKAEQAFTQILKLRPEGSRVLEAHAQYGLARIAASRGALYQAKALAEQCSATFEALGHRKRNTVYAFLGELPLGPIR